MKEINVEGVSLGAWFAGVLAGILFGLVVTSIIHIDDSRYYTFLACDRAAAIAEAAGAGEAGKLIRTGNCEVEVKRVMKR